MKVSELQFLLGLCPQRTEVTVDIDGKDYIVSNVKPMVDVDTENNKIELYCRIYCQEKSSNKV